MEQEIQNIKEILKVLRQKIDNLQNTKAYKQNTKLEESTPLWKNEEEFDQFVEESFNRLFPKTKEFFMDYDEF